MLTKKRLRLRCIAALVCVIFISGEFGALPSAGAASLDALQRTPQNSLLRDVRLFEAPSEFARLTDVHSAKGGPASGGPGSQETFIIHIQDAHSNFSGQENLANALRVLMERYDVRLVLSEGGWGDCSLTPMKKIASTETWRKVARRFLLSGELQGEEYLNLVSDLPMKIVGIENPKEYEEGLKNYRELTQHREEIIAYLTKMRQGAKKLKSKLYPAELLDYERSGEAELETRLKRLSVMAGAGSLDGYPGLKQLVRLQEKESSLNFDAANLEQAVLAEEIFQRGGKEDLESHLEKAGQMRGQKLAQLAYFQNTLNIAQEKGVDTAKFVNVLAYLDYLKEFSNLDFDAVLEQFEKAENEVYARLLSGADAARLRGIDRFLTLLMSAHRIQMTSDQFGQLLLNEPDFSTAAYQAFLNRQLAEAGYFEDMIPVSEAIETGRKALQAFYDSVSQRDETFIANLEKALENEKQSVAVLITGGYHTPHLKELLKEKGHGYAVLTPLVTTETSQKKYEKLLLSEKTPKKTVVAGGSSSKNRSLGALDDDLEKLVKKRTDGLRTALAVVNPSGALVRIAGAVRPGVGADEAVRDAFGSRLMEEKSGISRRDFLKKGATIAGAALLPRTGSAQASRAALSPAQSGLRDRLEEYFTEDLERRFKKFDQLGAYHGWLKDELGVKDEDMRLVTVDMNVLDPVPGVDAAMFQSSGRLGEGTAAIADRRISELETLLDGYWENLGESGRSASLPAYVRQRAFPGGIEERPQILQKALFVMSVYDPETYRYLEENNIQIYEAELPRGEWARTGGSRSWGRWGVPFISYTTRFRNGGVDRPEERSMHLAGALVHEAQHARTMPTSFAGYYWESVRDLREVSHLFKTPYFERASFEAQARFYRRFDVALWAKNFLGYPRVVRLTESAAVVLLSTNLPVYFLWRFIQRRVVIADSKPTLHRKGVRVRFPRGSRLPSNAPVDDGQEKMRGLERDLRNARANVEIIEDRITNAGGRGDQGELRQAEEQVSLLESRLTAARAALKGPIKDGAVQGARVSPGDDDETPMMTLFDIQNHKQRGESYALVKKDPTAWVVYADVMKLRARDETYGTLTADRIVLDVVEKAQEVANRHHGYAFRQGPGSDELGMAFPGHLSTTQIRGILEEINAEIDKLYQERLGAAGITGPLTEGQIAALEGFLGKGIRSLDWKDRAEGRRSVSKNPSMTFEKKPYESSEEALEVILLAAGIDKEQGHSIPLFTPWLPAGVVRLKLPERASADPSLSFDTSFAEAQNYQGVAKDRGVLVAIEGEDRIRASRVEKTRLLAPVDEDRIERALLSVREDLGKLTKKEQPGVLETTYAVFDHHGLPRILQVAMSDDSGEAKLHFVRGPPDNFYLITPDGRGHWRATRVTISILVENMTRDLVDKDTGKLVSLLDRFHELRRASGRAGEPAPKRDRREGDTLSKFGFKEVNGHFGPLNGNWMIKLANVEIYRAFKEAFLKDPLLGESDLFQALSEARYRMNESTLEAGFSVELTGSTTSSDDFLSGEFDAVEVLEHLKDLSESRVVKTTPNPDATGVYLKTLASNKSIWPQIQTDVARARAYRSVRAGIDLAQADAKVKKNGSRKASGSRVQDHSGTAYARELRRLNAEFEFESQERKRTPDSAKRTSAQRYPELVQQLASWRDIFSQRGEGHVLVIGPGILSESSPQTEDVLRALGPIAEYTVIDPDRNVLQAALASIPEEHEKVKIGALQASAETIADYGEQKLDLVIATNSVAYGFQKTQAAASARDTIARLIHALKDQGQLFIGYGEFFALLEPGERLEAAPLWREANRVALQSFVDRLATYFSKQHGLSIVVDLNFKGESFIRITRTQATGSRLPGSLGGGESWTFATRDYPNANVALKVKDKEIRWQLSFSRPNALEVYYENKLLGEAKAPALILDGDSLRLGQLIISFSDGQVTLENMLTAPLEIHKVSEFKPLSTGSRLVVDERPVDAGLLHAAHVRYDGAIRQMVNPDGRPLTAVYGGAGVDVSNLLESTDATDMTFIAEYPRAARRVVDEFAQMDPSGALSEWIDGESKGWLDYYKETKYIYGFGDRQVLQKSPGIQLALLRLELDAIGVKSSDIQEFYYDDDGHLVLRFLWAYDGGEKKARTITFIDGDLNRPETYARFLPARIDVYYQRAGMDIPMRYDEPIFLSEMDRRMTDGAFFVTDDHASIGTFGVFDRSGEFPSYLAVRSIPIPEEAALNDAIKFVTGRPGLKSFGGYGWQMSIRQKTEPPDRFTAPAPATAEVARMAVSATPEAASVRPREPLGSRVASDSISFLADGVKFVSTRADTLDGESLRLLATAVTQSPRTFAAPNVFYFASANGVAQVRFTSLVQLQIAGGASIDISGFVSEVKGSRVGQATVGDPTRDLQGLLGVVARTGVSHRALPVDVYRVQTPVEFRLVSPEVLGAGRTAQLQKLLQEFLGGRVFVQSAPSAATFTDLPGGQENRVVYVGANTDDLIAQAGARRAGVVLIDDFSGNFASANVAQMVFGGFAQRLDGLTDELTQLWLRMRANPTELTPRNFSLIKRVPPGSSRTQYVELTFRIFPVDWSAALSTAYKVLRSIASAA